MSSSHVMSLSNRVVLAVHVLVYQCHHQCFHGYVPPSHVASHKQLCSQPHGRTPLHCITCTAITPDLTCDIFLVHLPKKHMCNDFFYHTISSNTARDEFSVCSLLKLTAGSSFDYSGNLLRVAHEFIGTSMAHLDDCHLYYDQ